MRLLILINPQIDFCEGGALEIEGANEFLKKTSEQISNFDKIICIKEWHPANHICFAANHPWRYPGQIIQFKGKEIRLMLTHCVQNQFGAMVHPILKEIKFDLEINVGSDQFQESDQQLSTMIEKKLASFFKSQNIEEVKFLGLVHNEFVNNLEKNLLHFFPNIRIFPSDILNYSHPESNLK